MTAPDEPRQTREGRDFPVEEAAILLRQGVYLPDYPMELVADAWMRNYEFACAGRSALQRRVDQAAAILKEVLS